MILSNVEIQRAIDAGRLVLDPEPLPRRPGPDGADCPYQTSAVDLQLGDEISYSGFKGSITLELYNMGTLGISLYPGTPICQLIVETVKGMPFRNDSQFQGQQAAGGQI